MGAYINFSEQTREGDIFKTHAFREFRAAHQARLLLREHENAQPALTVFAQADGGLSGVVVTIHCKVLKCFAVVTSATFIKNHYGFCLFSDDLHNQLSLT